MASRPVVRWENEECVSGKVVIVGGGLAGAAAGIVLAEAGREVVLLERERAAQHKVCGEFLSQEAVHSLRVLGVDPGSLGAATIGAVRLAGARGVTEAPLSFEAMSMTRRRLDEALLQRAERVGVRISRGTHVRRLEREGALWRVHVDEAGPIETESLFVATGKHDVAERPRPAGKQSGMVGFKMYFRLQPEQARELAGHVELLLFRDGHAGLQLVEDGWANLGCIVKQRRLRELGGRWELLLEAMRRECPQLALRLAGAEALLARPLAVAPIPYGYVRAVSTERLWWLGDQAAVIPSFTGDGMAIALHTGRLAAAMYLQGLQAEAYQQRVRGELAGQVRLAVAISRGLVWRPTRALITGAVSVWPGLLTMAGRRTRIAESVQL